MSGKKIWIADCHCDTVDLLIRPDYYFNKINKTGHIDLPRLRQGGVKLQIFAVCVAAVEPPGRYLERALANIKRFHRCLDNNGSQLRGIYSRHDMTEAEESNSIACLLALEGAEPLEGGSELLALFYRLGVRCLSLTWNYRNSFAGGVSEEAAAGGLTAEGRKTIRQMFELGIMLDLAHISRRGFYEAVDLSLRPPLVSHANARALCDHPRNLDDDQLRLLASKGGVVGISYCPLFVVKEGRASLNLLADHFVHVASIAGVEHLAIGSDFDGIKQPVQELEDASCHPLLLDVLSRRGFLSEEIEMIAFKNVKRLLRQNLPEGGRHNE